MRLLIAASFLGWATPTPVYAQVMDGFFDIDLRSEHVAGNVYMVQRMDGFANVAVFIGDEGVLLVDSQFEPHAPQLRQAIADITDKEIKFLINTHVHPDHIGGNAKLAAEDVLIFAHDNMRVRMLEDRLRFPRGNGGFIPAAPASARPFITYSEHLTFHFGGEEVRIFLAPPAHTDGDTFVHFTESNVLHLGDVFRTTSYPIIDVYNGGTLAGTIDALNLAIETSDSSTKIIPGHGKGVVGRDELIEFRDMIVDVSTAVRQLIADGMTLDQVMNANVTEDYEERWGQVTTWSAADFVPIVYHQLGGGSRFEKQGN